jgi:hypothetical protein
MNGFRKAYSVAGAVLMVQFVIQLYLIASAVFTIFFADDNAKAIYSAFKDADAITLIHMFNGDLIALTILVMVVCSFGARYPRRTKILTGVLFLLILVQATLAHTGIPFLSGLHGVNALVLIGLGAYLTATTWAFGRRSSAAPSPLGDSVSGRAGAAAADPTPSVTRS